MQFFDAIAWLISFFYEITTNYAASISLLTLTVMIILTPLTLKSTRSIMHMQALQPEIKKLQVQFKDDRQKLNEEMMKFYKDNNISPVGGCLPMIAQMPIYFILYQVLRGLTRRSEDGTFDPKYLTSGKLFEDLHGSRTMKSFGIDLANNASDVLSADGLSKALPYFVLIILVAATTYIQQKQISGRTPSAQANPMSQTMLKIMPVFMGFICLQLPGALVLYMFVSNLYRVGQQQLISHTIYKPAHAAGLFDNAIEAKATESAQPGQSKGFLQNLLGDAAPRLGKNADHGFKDAKSLESGNGRAKSNGNGAGKSNGKSNGAGAKGSGASQGKRPTGSKPSTSASASSPTKPSAPRAPTGRTTPAGGRPSGANRKKKRR
jgi:YidC/Oxa1 family membrane protein insertase